MGLFSVGIDDNTKNFLMQLVDKIKKIEIKVTVEAPQLDKKETKGKDPEVVNLNPNYSS